MLVRILKDKKIILGSASPRRQELLRSLGIDFEIRISNTDENYPLHLSPEKVTEFLVAVKSENLSATIKAN
jgi:septum formation protein